MAMYIVFTIVSDLVHFVPISDCQKSKTRAGNLRGHNKGFGVQEEEKVSLCEGYIQLSILVAFYFTIASTNSSVMTSLNGEQFLQVCIGIQILFPINKQFASEDLAAKRLKTLPTAIKH